MKPMEITLDGIEGEPKARVLVSRKCHVDKDGHIVMCSGLSSVVDPDCRKGIRTQLMMNFKTGQEWYLFIVLSGDYVKKGGLVMNYCPFCGEDIIGHTPTGRQRKGK